MTDKMAEHFGINRQRDMGDGTWAEVVALISESALTDAVITIATSTTVSAAVDIGEGRVATDIEIPDAFTGTSISFRRCTTLGGTYRAMTDEAGILITATIPVGTNRSISLGNIIGHFYGKRFLRLVSDAAEPADRVLSIIHRPTS